MEKKLQNTNYIAIADWMLDLGLNTRELLTYALIYGFSQDNESCYYGSLEYLACWLGINDRTNATRYLKPLVEKGLIIKKTVTTKLNQKACLYKTVINKGSITKNPDIDYLIIQPFMLKELHLNGKDLLLYALIHGYSRKGSDNICSYQKAYFAKWLQCRKDHVQRQVDKALKKGLVIEVEGGFIAKTVENLENTQSDNTPTFDDVDFTQIDNTFTQTDNRNKPKLTTNNLTNNLNNNLNLVVQKNEINTDFDIIKFQKVNILKIKQILEAYKNSKEAKKLILDSLILLSNVVDNYSKKNINTINSKFTDIQYKKLFEMSLKCIDIDLKDKWPKDKESYISAQVSKYIKKVSSIKK